MHIYNVMQAPLENAVVIGGSGYLGKRLVNKLVEDREYKVHSLDLIIPPVARRNSGVYCYIQTDISNKDHMMKALEGMDVVFHTASLIPMTVAVTDDDMQRVNVDGTENIIEACRKNNIKRLVYTSSTCVALSKDPNMICEDVPESWSLPEDPLNTYVRTKGLAEKMIINANQQDGLKTCALRLAGLLGGADSKLMQNFMSACVIQFSKGESRISWVGVDSAARAHIVADKRLKEGAQTAGKVYNISIDDKFKISELYNFFAEENRRPLIVLPSWIVKGLVSINVYMYNKTGIVPLTAYLTPACFEFIQSHFTVSTERARKELGWEESRPWREVIRELIQEFKAESKLNHM